MYNDNKHPTDWPRGRRPDFQRERDGHYAHQEPYYTQPYSPKRRKLDSGEAEPVEFDSARRTVYPRYDSSGPRTQLPRPYYAGPYESLPRRDYGENHYYPRGEYGRPPNREYPPIRRYPDPIIDSERGSDHYGRRNYDAPDLGKKRTRDGRYTQPTRPREFDNRTPLSPNTPIKNLANPVGNVRDIYDPLPPSTLPSSNIPSPAKTEPPNNSQQGKTTQSPKHPDRQSPPSDEDGALSKKEIIEKMDQLDTQITQIEEEIEHFKKRKTLWQRQTDKSKLSDVDRILLTNQEVASETAEYMKLFQKVDVVSKTKANLVHVPDNLHSHSLKRPVMMRHMKQAMLETKEKNKKLAVEFELKRQKWVKSIRSAGLTLPKSVALLNNAQSPLPYNTPTTQANSRGGRRSRAFSDAVRSEAEFSQVMQQLNETERQDPNLRYTKTLAQIPPLIVDPLERARTFYDNNRFVENCAVEYQQHQLTNPWNTTEQEIFLSKYIAFPKQFAKIASFLPNKSIEEVICYYFKNKHRLNLKGIIEEIQERNVKKRPQQRVRSAPRKSSAFVSKEVADLHSNNDSTYWNRPRERTRNAHVAIPTSRQLSRERSAPTRKTSKSRVRNKPASPPRKSSTSRKNITVQSAGIDQLCFVSNVPSPWTEMEVNQFKIALVSFGTDFKAIADFISSKNHWECRSFYFNFKEELSLSDLISNGSSKKENTLKDTPMYSSGNGEVSNHEKTSITSLLNSPVLPATKEPQNWILEEPVIPQTTSFPAVGTSALGNDSKSFSGSIASDFRESVVKEFEHGGNTVNIRHSFDSFSPLENTETKNSVTWCVSDIPSNPLRHSSAEVTFGYFKTPYTFPSVLVPQESSIREMDPKKNEIVENSGETVEVEASGDVNKTGDNSTLFGFQNDVMSNVTTPAIYLESSKTSTVALPLNVETTIPTQEIKPVHPYSVLERTVHQNSTSVFPVGNITKQEEHLTADNDAKMNESDCTEDSDDDLTLHIVTDPETP